MREWQTVWTFDSQDMRREPTGFQGRFTRVPGLTNREFENEAQAVARMEAKVTSTRKWRYIGAMAGFDHVWRHASGPWFLCLTTEQRLLPEREC